MAITGAHVLLYTSEPEAARDVFRDVLGWPHVDTGGGWLIFKMPPAELGVHPAQGPGCDAGWRHQVSLMCDDLDATMADLRAAGVEMRGEPVQEPWGTSVLVVLPGDLELQLYQPNYEPATNLA